MLHGAAFHQGVPCMLRRNQSSEKEIQYTRFLESITFEPSMDHPDCIVFNCMKNSIGLKRKYFVKKSPASTKGLVLVAQTDFCVLR